MAGNVDVMFPMMRLCMVKPDIQSFRTNAGFVRFAVIATVEMLRCS